MKPLIEFKLANPHSVSVKANANAAAILAPAGRKTTMKMLLKGVKKK
jgi:hypothetical protein